MNVELLEKQVAKLKHIYRKGFGAYRKPVQELDEMVDAGLLTRSPIGPFGEIGYRLSPKGVRFVKGMLSK